MPAAINAALEATRAAYEAKRIELEITLHPIAGTIYGCEVTMTTVVVLIPSA